MRILDVIIEILTYTAVTAVFVVIALLITQG